MTQRHVAIVRDFLDDKLPSLLDDSCNGCEHHACHRELDDAGPMIAGGMSARLRRVNSCGAESFTECPKMTAILEELTATNPKQHWPVQVNPSEGMIKTARLLKKFMSVAPEQPK